LYFALDAGGRGLGFGFGFGGYFGAWLLYLYLEVVVVVVVVVVVMLGGGSCHMVGRFAARDLWNYLVTGRVKKWFAAHWHFIPRFGSGNLWDGIGQKTVTVTAATFRNGLGLGLDSERFWHFWHLIQRLIIGGSEHATCNLLVGDIGLDTVAASFRNGRLGGSLAHMDRLLWIANSHVRCPSRIVTDGIQVFVEIFRRMLSSSGYWCGWLHYSIC
jgi:hypothetical protein